MFLPPIVIFRQNLLWAELTHGLGGSLEVQKKFHISLAEIWWRFSRGLADVRLFGKSSTEVQ